MRDKLASKLAGVLYQLLPLKASSIVRSRFYIHLRYRRPFCWAWFILLFLTGTIRNVPVASLTNLGAFSFSQDGWHPYTAVLKEIDGDPELHSQDSILREFYNRFIPESRDGFLPIHSDDSWQSTKKCFLPPWRGGKIVDFSEQFEHWTGPKSDESTNFLFHQLKALCAKLESEGYRPWAHPGGFIQVFVLEKSRDDFRCLVVNGQHRAAIISHLGLKSAWVRLQPPGDPYPDNMPNKIKLSQTDTWERVADKQFTPRDARSFFEAYFDYDGRVQAASLGLL